MAATTTQMTHKVPDGLFQRVDAKFLTRKRDGAFVQRDRTQRSADANVADLFTRL
jgi:hypothetical protein